MNKRDTFLAYRAFVAAGKKPEVRVVKSSDDMEGGNYIIKVGDETYKTMKDVERTDAWKNMAKNATQQEAKNPSNFLSFKRWNDDGYLAELMTNDPDIIELVDEDTMAGMMWKGVQGLGRMVEYFAKNMKNFSGWLLKKITDHNMNVKINKLKEAGLLDDDATFNNAEALVKHLMKMVKQSDVAGKAHMVKKIMGNVAG